MEENELFSTGLFQKSNYRFKFLTLRALQIYIYITLWVYSMFSVRNSLKCFVNFCIFAAFQNGDKNSSFSPISWQAPCRFK